MKKGFVVIPIFFALSFFVSIGFVLPSLEQTTQTLSKSKQQVPSSPAAVESAIAKPAFWDLEVGSIFIKGQLVKIGGPNHTVNVKVGETVTFKCTYRMKTPPVGGITQADAKRWGAGNLPFTIRMQVHSTKMGIEDKDLLKDKTLPKFTYEDVINWKKNLQPGVGNAWDDDVYFEWTPGAEYVGNMFISVVYLLDVNHVIPEPDEQNNHINTAGGILNIVVTP